MSRYLFVWITLGLLGDRVSSQELETVALKEKVEAWAVAPSTGRVFAAFNESPTGHAGQIFEINREGKRLQTFRLDKTPRGMFVVQDRLVVFSNSPLQLDAFDLETNQPSGSLLIPGVGAGSICVGGSDSEFLYVFNNSADGRRVPQLLQIDVLQMKLRKKISLDEFAGPSFRDAVISGNGKRLVCRTGSTSIVQYAFDEDDLSHKSERRLTGQTRGRIGIDPLGEYWSSGSQIRSHDSSETHGQFEGSFLLIHPQMDLVVGYGATELFLQRLSDSTEVTRVTLHRSFADSRGMTVPMGRTVDLQFTDDGKTLFVGERNHGHWVDLVPLEKSLAKRIESESESMARDFPLEPLTKTLSLGFEATGLEFSPSAKRAVVWGHQSKPLAARLAIVDLEQSKVLQSKTIITGVRCAAIDDAYVYVAPRSGTLIDRYRHDFSDSKKAFVKSPPTRLIPYGEEWIVCQSNETQRLDRQTLLPNMPTIQLPSQRTSFSVAMLDRQTLSINGRVVDRQSQRTLRYHAEACLPVVSKAAFDLHLGQTARINLWGHSVGDGRLMDHRGTHDRFSSSGRKFGDLFEPIASAISHEYPCVACVGKLYQPDRGVSKFHMEFRHLPDGRRTDLIAIPELDELVFGVPSTAEKSILVHVVGAKVYVLAGDALLFMPLPESVTQDDKRPVCFSRQQPTDVFAVGGEESFTLNVDGNRAGGEFRISVPVTGMQIDKASGKITLDTPAMWKAFAKSSQTRKSTGRRNGRSTTKGQLPLDAYESKSNAIRHQWLTAQTLKQDTLAAHFPVAVQFKDATGNVDSVRFSMVLTGPAFGFENDPVMPAEDFTRAHRRGPSSVSDRL
jgi:hypothetical protein